MRDCISACSLWQPVHLWVYGLSGLYMNYGLWFSSPKKIIQTSLHVFPICVGVILVNPHCNAGSSAHSAIVWSWPLCLRQIDPW